MNSTSSISAAGKIIVAVMFSRIRGARIRRCAFSTLRATTSTASEVQGSGARCPIDTPPARVNAMCSLHQGGSSQLTSSAIVDR